MGGIFICYRREDSIAYAGRLYDRLADQFGEEQIFMDIDTMRAGLDFVNQLENAVAGCDILIAVIGKSWLTTTNEDGKRQLDDSQDFVRIEIKAALERNIPVVPLLVGGAVVPKGTDLPNEIAPLSRRHAVEISDTRFRADVSRFIEDIKEHIPEKSSMSSSELKPRDSILTKLAKKQKGNLWMGLPWPKTVGLGIILFLVIAGTFATYLILKEGPQDERVMGTSVAPTIEELKAGVVKIISKSPEMGTLIGAGIIVQLKENEAYIITAAHVIAGGIPHVVFYPKQTEEFKARILGGDFADEYGTALIFVKGSLPLGLRALTLDSTGAIFPGQEVTLIGFPRLLAVPWAVTIGRFVGQKGKDLIFTGGMREGSSGGPLIFNGMTLGMMVEASGDFNKAVSSKVLQYTLEGWGMKFSSSGTKP